jgi:hypothetical protein
MVVASNPAQQVKDDCSALEITTPRPSGSPSAKQLATRDSSNVATVIVGEYFTRSGQAK